MGEVGGGGSGWEWEVGGGYCTTTVLLLYYCTSTVLLYSTRPQTWAIMEGSVGWKEKSSK